MQSYRARSVVYLGRLWTDSFFFFFNDTATTEIYTLSLHDALPILPRSVPTWRSSARSWTTRRSRPSPRRSEEHTSELQSRLHLVCRLLLEKKKTKETNDFRSPMPRALARALVTRMASFRVRTQETN